MATGFFSLHTVNCSPIGHTYYNIIYKDYYYDYDYYVNPNKTSEIYIFANDIVTGEHQPYAAGLKSGHSPAEASRFNHTFFRGSNLLTVAGEPPVASPANLGR